MSRNKIEQLVPRLFLKLDKLQELNLNSNPLRGNIDADRFKDLGKLRILRLSDCHQTQFNSMALQYLLSLETLDLSHNRLKFFTIDESSHFPHFVPKLKYLYLHDNQIQSIFNGTFGGLSLRQLTMSFNQLQFLQRESFSNVIVEDLDLSFNNLKVFSL